MRMPEKSVHFPKLIENFNFVKILTVLSTYTVFYIYTSFFFFLIFFLWPHLQHMEVPRLGNESELQLPA